MSLYKRFDAFVNNLVGGVHDFSSHTFKVYLTNSPPNAASHSVKSDIAEISSGNGYVSGGNQTSITLNRSGGTVTVSNSDPATWTASGGSIGPFQYAVLYNDTPSSPNDPLVSYFDYGHQTTILDGETAKVDFSKSLFVVDIVTAPNLVVNGDFGSGITGWTSSDPSEFSADNVIYHTGSSSLKLTTSNALATARSTKFTLLPNRFYRLSARGYSAVPVEVRVEQFISSTVAGDPLYPAWTGFIGGSEWDSITVDFVTELDVFQGQVYVLLRQNGTANFDDFSVTLLPEEEPFSNGDGVGVDFLGHPSVMDMRIVNASLSGVVLSVDTSAAHFDLDSSTGILSCGQVLGGVRDRATVQLPIPGGGVSLLAQDDDRVIITSDKFDLAIHGDSLAVMAFAPGQQASVTKNFAHDFYAYQEGFLTAVDGIGGVAVFPGYQRGTGLTNSYSVAEGSGTPPNLLTYTFGLGARLAVGVFPPRPFDWLKSFDDQIIHTDLHPPYSVLLDWSSIANVVVLHEGIWKGSAPKVYLTYTPTDSAALQRVINDAHALGMKVLPYFSSDFFAEQQGGKFIAEIQRLRDIYGFDGVYYDGINAYNWEYAYETMRRTRDLFPNGPVYLHISYGIPFRKENKNLFLPQVESLADYTLQGESVDMNGWDDPYLNYVARGYTVSNVIGTLKYDDLLVSGVHPSQSQVLTGLLALNMRQRITAYPSGSVYPTVASLGPDWPNYRAQVAAMKAAWEAGG